MILSPLFVLFFTAFPSSAFHVMIDPGHGGTDTGAVQGDAREADIVLSLALKLRDRIQKNTRWEVSLTRDDNSGISLQDRVKAAEAKGVDIFVSLHANSAPVRKAKGIELFFENTKPPDEEALYLAHLENQIVAQAKEDGSFGEGKKGDLAAILEDLRRQKRQHRSLRLSSVLKNEWNRTEPGTTVSIKQAPFHVVNQTAMPAVLIEVGFLTNPQEARRLLTSERQGELAESIYSSLLAYEKTLRKPERPAELSKAQALDEGADRSN